MTVFSDLWSEKKRYPKPPLKKTLTLICGQNETGMNFELGFIQCSVWI